MKLVSYVSGGEIRTGLLYERGILDVRSAAKIIGITLPSSMMLILQGWEKNYSHLKSLDEACRKGKIDYSHFTGREALQLLAPVPNPLSIRDAYAFRQHVETARRNRGVDMIPEFDQFPVFYFTNHFAVFGEGDIIVQNDHLDRLDFELECAVVIGKAGSNIKAEDADEYIAGYMIYNDLSARALQREEMKLNLGPAKGKDFANIFGPALVTKDSLREHKIPGKNGDKYDLPMRAYHNDELISEGNLKDMNWTFAEIIERISYGVVLYPGEIIGSGTVGTGCYLELNGTRALMAKEKGEEYEPVWLEEGDTIELEIEGLGKLQNTIVKDTVDRSILKRNPADQVR